MTGFDLGPCLALAAASGIPAEIAVALLPRLEAGATAGIRDLMRTDQNGD